MVAGLLKFKEYFKDYADSYVLIGGAACDILFTENEADFRAHQSLPESFGILLKMVIIIRSF